MNTLADYDLKEGDFVKCFGDWQEVAQIKDGFAMLTFANLNLENTPCEAVLRPGFIMREKLDQILKGFEGEPIGSKIGLPNAIFCEQIHPTKPERKDSEPEWCRICEHHKSYICPYCAKHEELSPETKQLLATIDAMEAYGNEMIKKADRLKKELDSKK